MSFPLNRPAWRNRLLCIALLTCLCRMATAVDTIASTVSLDHGFSLLYNLDFARAHQVFLSFQQEHPDNPMGPVCDAAGFLFSEFNRLGVLEAQFYADDRAFAARKKLTPDVTVRDRFYSAQICDAAGFLFSEFNRLGVLEAQFYADDRAFAARKKLTPDVTVRDRFYAALNEADSRARSRLAKNAKDRDALLALTMSSGLKADYAA